MSDGERRIEERLNQILAELEALKKKSTSENNGIMDDAVTLTLGSVVGAITGVLVQYALLIKNAFGLGYPLSLVSFAIVTVILILGDSLLVSIVIHRIRKFRKKRAYVLS